MEKDRRRLRDAVWFETLPEGRELPRGDVIYYCVAPYFYLTSVVVLPVAAALAVVRPGGIIPYWIWAVLAGLVSVNFRVFASEECGRQGRSEQGFFALRAWSWLALGGGFRQALRTIAANRRSMTTAAQPETPTRRWTSAAFRRTRAKTRPLPTGEATTTGLGDTTTSTGVPPNSTPGSHQIHSWGLS